MARSRLRQLIPTKFATAYRTNHGDGTDPHTPEFCVKMSIEFWLTVLASLLAYLLGANCGPD